MTRDNCLVNRRCGFIHQAIRYRGKANYRDSLLLSYDFSNKQAENLISDMTVVLESFFKMAFIYCSKRINEKTWSGFLADIKTSCFGEYLKTILPE